MFTFSDDEYYFHDIISISNGMSIVSYVLRQGSINDDDDDDDDDDDNNNNKLLLLFMLMAKSFSLYLILSA